VEGGAERTGAAETHAERDLGDRCAEICQQRLGALDAAAGDVAIRRLTEGLSPGEFKEQLRWFAKDVMPAFAS